MSNQRRITGLYGKEGAFKLPDIFSSPTKKSRTSTSPVRKTKKKKKVSARRFDIEDEYDDDDGHVAVRPTSYESSSDSDGDEEDSKYYYDNADTSRMISDRHNLINNMKREWSSELERIHFNKEYYKMKTPHLIKYLKRIKLDQNFQENSSKLVDSTVEELFDILFQSFAQGSSDGSNNSNYQLLGGKKGRLFEVSEFGFLVKSKKNVMVKKFKNSFRQTILKFHRNYNVFKKFERGNLRRQRRQKAKEIEMEEKRSRFRSSLSPKVLHRKSAREFCEEEMNFVQLFYQIKSDLAKEREIVNVLQRRLESEILELRNKDFEILCLREQLKKRDHMIDKLKKKCYKELMKMKSHFSRNQFEENEKMKKRMNAYRELLKNPLPYTLMKTGQLDLDDHNNNNNNLNQKKKKKKKKKKKSTMEMMFKATTSERKKESSTLEYLKKKMKEEKKKEEKKKKEKEKEEEEGEETDFFKSSDSEDEDEEFEESETEKKERINRAFAPIHFFQPLSIFCWGNSVKLEMSKMLEKQKNIFELLIHQLKKSFLQKERKEFQKYLDIVNRLNEILIASSGSSSGNRIPTTSTSGSSSSNNNSNQRTSFDSSKHITDQFQEQSNIIANLKHQNTELQNEMNRMREKEFQTAKETIHNMIQAEKLKKKNEFLTSQIRRKMINIQELCDRLEEFKLITRNEYDHYMTHDAFGDTTFEQTNIDQTRNVNFLVSKKKALRRVEEENKKFLRLLDRVKEIKQLEIDCARHNSLSEENMIKVDRKWNFIKKTLYNYVLAL